MIRRHAALVVALVAQAAHADVVTLPNTKATIDLPDTWQAIETQGVVFGAKGPARELLAITRAQVANPDAWRSKKREAYVDQIEKGVAASIKGYKRVSRKLVEVNAVPTLELEAKRDDGAMIVFRILLFRTYALSLAIEVPKRGSAKPARAIAATFAPAPTTTPANSP